MQRLLAVIYRIHSLKIAGFTVDLSSPGSITTAQFIPHGLNQARLVFSDGINCFRFENLVSHRNLSGNPMLLHTVMKGGLVQEIRYSIDMTAGDAAVPRQAVWQSEDLHHVFAPEKEQAVMLRGDQLERWGKKLFERTPYQDIFPKSPLKLRGLNLVQFAD